MVVACGVRLPVHAVVGSILQSGAASNGSCVFCTSLHQSTHVRMASQSESDNMAVIYIVKMDVRLPSEALDHVGCPMSWAALGDDRVRVPPYPIGWAAIALV